MNETLDALRGVTLDAPMTARNLAVFPLLGAPGVNQDLLLLSEALKMGLVTISEVSHSGAVPKLLLDNRARASVLLLDGAHLVGCKQNRVLNTSVLAPAELQLELPVSCVEQGRWHYERAHFEASPRPMFAELRAAKVMQVSHSMEMRSCAEADQGAIWNSIASKASRLGSNSASGAMEGIYGQREDDLEQYRHPTRPVADQCGAVFAINGRVVGLELLPTAHMWQQCSEGIVLGHALDALDHFTTLHPQPHKSAAKAFIERVGRLEQRRFPGVGLGEDVRLSSGDTAGMALTFDDRVVHMCAFDVEQRSRHGSSQRFGRDHTGVRRGGSNVF